ncbi:MAG TPA: Hsp20/alpha crystallin family protein [Marinagarivorans sp.]
MNIFPRQQLNELHNLLDHAWLPLREPGGRYGTISPKVDLREKADTYEISLELPGLKKEDIEISLSKGVLTVEAQNSEEKTEAEHGRVIRQERHYGKYVRSFELNPNIHQADISAKFEHGVLIIDIPKAPKSDEPATRITIG